MSGLLRLQKIKEVSFKEIIASEYVCYVANYPRIAKMQGQRLRITNHFRIGDKISGILQIFPMGINSDYNDKVSIVLVLESEVLKNIEADFQVLIMNKSSTLAVKPSFEYFEKKPFKVKWTMSRAADSDFLLDSTNQMLQNGLLKINLTIRVYNNIEPQKAGAKSNFFVDQLRSPHFGDTKFNVKGVIFCADRSVIERGNQELATLISKDDSNPTELNCLSVKEFENILIDCYLNVCGNIVENKVVMFR